MTRPRSIILFERFYFAALALEILQFLLASPAALDQFTSNDAFPLSRTATILFIVLVHTAFLALALALWSFAAHRANNVARWIIAILNGSDVLAIPMVFMLDLWPLWQKLLIALFAICSVASVVMLFRPDSNRWFARKRR